MAVVNLWREFVMQEHSSLDEIKKLWEQEIDKYVLKAAIEDITEYPQEVRTIIIEEAYQRGFITGEEKNDERLLITRAKAWQVKVIERKAKRRSIIDTIISPLLFIDFLSLANLGLSHPFWVLRFLFGGLVLLVPTVFLTIVIYTLRGIPQPHQTVEENREVERFLN